ncbi:MAG: hypothetical protein HY741_18330 [Chloroflexi bacterium]|nr:hypothetical protein [Chloroflexota bacterium]
MNTGLNKLTTLWLAVLTVLLLASLGMNAAWVQAANDPPVKMYTARVAHDAGWGDATTNNKSVDSAVNWTVLLSVPVNFTGTRHVHHCAVTASSDVQNSDGEGGASQNRYLFDMTMDNLSGANDGSSTRTVELNDSSGVDDPNVMQVGSTRMFGSVSAGAHTFRWLAKKEAAGVTNTNVLDSSMIVICVKERL